jgi:hypothetical protein
VAIGGGYTEFTSFPVVHQKTEKKQKEKLQEAIESRERQKTRSLEEDKSRTP